MQSAILVHSPLLVLSAILALSVILVELSLFSAKSSSNAKCSFSTKSSFSRIDAMKKIINLWTLSKNFGSVMKPDFLSKGSMDICLGGWGLEGLFRKSFHGRCPLGRGRHNVKKGYIYLCVCARHFYQKLIQMFRTTRVVSRMARRIRIAIRRIRMVIRIVIIPRMVTIPRKVTIHSHDLLIYLEYCR